MIVNKVSTEEMIQTNLKLNAFHMKLVMGLQNIYPSCTADISLDPSTISIALDMKNSLTIS